VSVSACKERGEVRIGKFAMDLFDFALTRTTPFASFSEQLEFMFEKMDRIINDGYSFPTLHNFSPDALTAQVRLV
jgi:hypothetical protein